MTSEQPYFHIILQRFDAQADEAFFAAVRRLVERASREVPGVLETYFAPNVSPFAAGWTHVRLTKFVSRAAHEAYQISPLHAESVRLIVPRMQYAVGDLDFAMVEPGAASTAKLRADDRPYYHFVLMQPKVEFDTSLLTGLKEHTERVRREVPGLVEFSFERNISPFAEDWTYVHLSKYTSKAAHDGYQQHPAHDALRDITMPRVAEAVAGDVDTAMLG